MKARELSAKLNNLTLVGYEDGKYQWVGTDKQWEASELVCGKCKGRGWYIVANGTEDYDKEVCDCQLN